MHKLQMYENLRDMLESEVKDIEKQKDFTDQSLDCLYKLMNTIKNIDKCIDRENGGQSYDMKGYSGGQSYDMNGYSGGSMRMPQRFNMSYGRDGDNDGRYNESSNDNFRYSKNRGYAYESSGRLVSKLENVMDEAKTDHERIAIMDCIDRIR